MSNSECRMNFRMSNDEMMKSPFEGCLWQSTRCHSLCRPDWARRGFVYSVQFRSGCRREAKPKSARGINENEIRRHHGLLVEKNVSRVLFVPAGQSDGVQHGDRSDRQQAERRPFGRVDNSVFVSNWRHSSKESSESLLLWWDFFGFDHQLVYKQKRDPPECDKQPHGKKCSSQHLLSLRH